LAERGILTFNVEDMSAYLQGYSWEFRDRLDCRTFRSCYANFVPESIRIAIMVRINGCENVFHNELSYYKTGFSTLTYRRGYETLFGKRRRTKAAV